jgi:hypothetical protein
MLQSDSSFANTPFFVMDNAVKLSTKSSDHLYVTIATVRCHRLQFDDTEMLCFPFFFDSVSDLYFCVFI